MTCYLACSMMMFWIKGGRANISNKAISKQIEPQTCTMVNLRLVLAKPGDSISTSLIIEDVESFS